LLRGIGFVLPKMMAGASAKVLNAGLSGRVYDAPLCLVITVAHFIFKNFMQMFHADL